MTPRRGPRPLPLHLGLLALRRWMAVANLPLANLPPTRPRPSGSASPPWNADWPRSKPGRAGVARIAEALAAGRHPPEAFAQAVWAALGRADAGVLAGVAAYRRHPWRRGLEDPPAIWAEGGSRLLDYGVAGGGPVVLFVPSLINRAQVLDLLPEGSMLRHLAGQGVRPLLLDWGEPGPVERGFGLTDYVAGRLERALGAIPGPVVLAGYCMGGLLALAAAQRRPDRVRALALLATPWDFWAEDADQAQSVGALLPVLEPLLAAAGALPVDAIQAIFAGLDPFSITARYRGFAGQDPGSARARRFVALEDWLNDGVALAAPVARECLGQWYGRNAPARGEWRIAGAAVEPGQVRMPAFLAIPSRDRIVPPATALALGRAMPGALVHQAAAGHIGMVAGTGAEAALWRPLLRWIRDLDGAGRR